MKTIKCFLLLLTALSLSMPAFAYEDPLFAPVDERNGFRVGIDALYLQPTNSDLFYVTKISPLPLLGTTNLAEENLAVEPDYHWGAYSFIGYAFPCTSNDVTLAYTYLHSTGSAFIFGDSNAGTLAPYTLPVPPLFISTTFPLILGSKEGQSKINLNAVDLEGGQHFRTLDFDMRMFAGLRYATVDYNLNTVMFNNDIVFPAPPSNQGFNSEFKGLGPRVGVNGYYCLGSGFGINANMNASLLIGHLNSYFSSSINIGQFANNFYFEAKSDTQTRIVPVLEGKLGFDYTYSLGNDRNESALILEAGYQATNYFNVVDHTRVAAVASPSGLFSYFNSQNITIDVGFDGIYVGIKYYV